MLDSLDYHNFLDAARGVGELIQAKQWRSESRRALQIIGMTDIACAILEPHATATPYVKLVRFATRIIFLNRSKGGSNEILRQQVLVASSIVCCTLKFFGLGSSARHLQGFVGTIDLLGRLIVPN